MESVNWKMWKATLDHKTCRDCKKMHGKIYWVKEVIYPHPPLHPFCRCIIEQLKSIRAGLGTKDGTDGADIWLKINGHLPEKSGRIWYEADINYKWGYRGNDRIPYSNDGLIFVTYDHYKTFIEIV